MEAKSKKENCIESQSLRKEGDGPQSQVLQGLLGRGKCLLSRAAWALLLETPDDSQLKRAWEGRVGEHQVLLLSCEGWREGKRAEDQAAREGV